MQKRTLSALVFAVALGAASYAAANLMADKLPKCSGKLCHSTCSADILCASGALVKTCADFCSGN